MPTLCVRDVAGFAKRLHEIGRRLAIILDDQDPHSRHGSDKRKQTAGRTWRVSDLPQDSNGKPLFKCRLGEQEATTANVGAHKRRIRRALSCPHVGPPVDPRRSQGIAKASLTLM